MLPLLAIIFANALYTWLFFVISFAILGAGIKYIDDAFDENAFSKKKAMLLAPFLGVFYAFLMSLHQTAATILAAFLVGVLLSGKINNKGFYLQLFFWAIAIFIFDNITLSVIPLGLLILSSILDEKGNDLSDVKKIKNKFLDFWFKHRLTMDAVALFLTFFGAIELVFFASFISFDLSYMLVGAYSKTKNQL